MVLTMISQDYMGMDMKPVCQMQKYILNLEDNIKKLFFYRQCTHFLLQPI